MRNSPLIYVIASLNRTHWTVYLRSHTFLQDRRQAANMISNVASLIEYQIYIGKGYGFGGGFSPITAKNTDTSSTR